MLLLDMFEFVENCLEIATGQEGRGVDGSNSGYRGLLDRSGGHAGQQAYYLVSLLTQHRVNLWENE
jgi:hypothetical protein